MNKEKELKGFAFHTDDFISKKELTSELENIKKRKFVSQPARYKSSDANVWREGYNKAVDDLKQKFGV